MDFGGDWSPLLGFGVGAVLAGAAWLLYRRETRAHPHRLCAILPWLRAGAVFLVVLMLAGPVLRHRHLQGTLTRLLFFVDGSRSMGIADLDMEPERKEAIARGLGWIGGKGKAPTEADGARERTNALTRFDKATRSDRVRSLLFEGGEEGLLSGLADRFDIQVFALENSEARLLWKGAEGVAQLPAGLPEPLGASTDLLSTGLRQAVSPLEGSPDWGAGGAPSTAVVLLSDGQHNIQSAPIALAKELGDRRIPVYTLGYGAVVAPSDLALLSVDAPETVFFEDRVLGTLTIKDEMPPGQEFRVRIESGGRLLWEKNLVTSRRHGFRLPFDFSVAELVRETLGGMRAGERRAVVPLSFEAAIAPVVGEREARNNTSAFVVRATTAKRKILLLDGRPRWDSLFVRNIFQRDSRWQVNALLSAGTGASERWPRGEKTGMFPSKQDALNEYDLVVVGDLPQRTLSETEWRWLSDFAAKRGGGVLFVDGQRGHLAEHLAVAGETLGAMLPVSFEAQSGGYSTEVRRWELTESGRSVGALALDPGGDPAVLWRQMPAPHWLGRVRALPGSETLLEAAAQNARQPVLVWRQFGAGRVAYFGCDETWRWRADVAEKYQERFWNQLLAAVAEPKYAAGDDQVSLDTDRFRYPSGGIAEIRVRLREPFLSQRGRDAWRAVLWRDGQRVASVALSGDDSRTDAFRGRTAPLETGAYTVGVESAGGDTELPLRVSFDVGALPLGELGELALNEDLLKRIADESGGKYLREEFSDQLKETLSALETGKLVENETALWQSYWWFSLVLLLLSVEWYLRKRLGLV